MTDAARRPLAGRTVVVTRPRRQAAALAEPLAALGAQVLLAPTIRIVPRAVDDQIVNVVVGELADYTLIVFTSTNAVDAFLGYFTELGVPLATLDAAILAAVGPATAAALEERGLSCQVVADEHVAEGLLDALARRGLGGAGARVLLPRAREARAVLPQTLRARGAHVDVLPVYDTVATESSGRAAGAHRGGRLHHLHVRQHRAPVRGAHGALWCRATARRAAPRRPPVLHRPRHQRRAAPPRPDAGRGGRR